MRCVIIAYLGMLQVNPLNLNGEEEVVEPAVVEAAPVEEPRKGGPSQSIKDL